MKGFERKDQYLSLCGLNCQLCPMHLDGFCPGCGGGAGNQSCAIARCSLERGGVEYCFQCGAYPCQRYDHIDEFDSFITHRRRGEDMRRAQKMGLERYRREQEEKAALLKMLLQTCNAGRRKTFYCLAVNLLPLEDIQKVMEQLDGLQTVQEREYRAVQAFEALAKQCGVTLKLRRKQKEKQK